MDCARWPANIRLPCGLASQPASQTMQARNVGEQNIFYVKYVAGDTHIANKHLACFPFPPLLSRPKDPLRVLGEFLLQRSKELEMSP